MPAAKRKAQQRPKTALGKFIFARREALGLTRKELACMLGISAKGMHNLEYGRKTLDRVTAAKLAQTLNYLPEQFEKFVKNREMYRRKRRKKTKSLFGRFVRRRRDKFSISLANLAIILGVTKQRLSQIETQRFPLSRYDCLIPQLAEVLRVKERTLRRLLPPRKKYTRHN